MSRRLVAADTETRGIPWYDPECRAFLGTWADESGSYAAWEDDPAAVERFIEALEDADVIAFHNAPFDVHHIRERWGFDCLLHTNALIVDTDQLARVVLPERATKGDENGDRSSHGYKLKQLSKALLGEDSDEGERVIAELAEQAGIKLKSHGGYYKTGQAFPEQMEHYAKLDTELTRDLLPVLESKLDPRSERIWRLERKLQPILIEAEQLGVPVDQSKVEPLKRAWTERRDRAHEAVGKVLGKGVLGQLDDPGDKDSPDALREALLEHGVPLYRTTPSGQLATNKFALQEFEKDFPVIADLFEYRKASKFLATYIGPMDGRERVHPSFWQQGAWTGRMSCSRPNLQNLPVRGEGSSELREMFVPEPGHCLVVSDFSQIELRLLAYYLHDDGFKAKIESGVDVFLELAGVLKTQGFDVDRSAAKNGAYAITYGAGGGRLTDMFGLDPGPYFPEDHPAIVAARARGRDWPKPGPQYAQGRALARTVKGWFPGYNALQKRLREKVQQVGHVNTIMGRKQVVSPDKAYVAGNALVQGSAADIFKQAVINVAEAIRPLGARPVLFVHDEIASMCPLEHAEECRRLQDEAMEAAFDLSPALKVEGTICPNNYAEGK